MDEIKQRTLSVLVDNTAGVLSRVAGLFARRGYNIDSLSVGVTADPRYSRITVVASGDDQVLEQITKQVSKLIDVIDVKVLKPEDSVQRELMLVKVKVDDVQRQSIFTLTGIFRANIVDVGNHSLICEVQGSRSKLEAFLQLLNGYEVLELARTGITGLSRGMDDVLYL